MGICLVRGKSGHASWLTSIFKRSSSSSFAPGPGLRWALRFSAVGSAHTSPGGSGRLRFRHAVSLKMRRELQKAGESMESYTLVSLLDLFLSGVAAGKAWRAHNQDNDVSHAGSELQNRLSHLERACLPGPLVNAWQQGFLAGIRGEEVTCLQVPPGNEQQRMKKMIVQDDLLVLDRGKNNVLYRCSSQEAWVFAGVWQKDAEASMNAFIARRRVRVGTLWRIRPPERDQHHEG